MRIISFTKRREKLSQDVFTTFRFPRKDKDWWVGETVQVFFKSRSPQRERLGVARIIGKELKHIGDSNITENEAKEDGFESLDDMRRWMERTYTIAKTFNPINKLTLMRMPEIPN